MTDKEEMDFIYNYVTSDVWIGGKRSCTSCTWEWINGGVISYTYWYHGEPNNSDAWKPENCIESVNRWNNKWNDGNCGAKHEFLCKSV